MEASGQSRRSVDRSKFHLGDNASVAKIALNDRPSSSGQASSHFRESKGGRQGGGGQSAFGHFELVPSRPGRASGVRHSSTSVDAAPPSPQEVRVEWGRNLLGREAAREGESLFKWFRALSLTTPFCTHSATGSGGRGRGDIKGFQNPKKAFGIALQRGYKGGGGDALRPTTRRPRPRATPEAFPFFFFESRAENDFKFS